MNLTRPTVHMSVKPARSVKSLRLLRAPVGRALIYVGELNLRYFAPLRLVLMYPHRAQRDLPFLEEGFEMTP